MRGTLVEVPHRLDHLVAEVDRLGVNLVELDDHPTFNLLQSSTLTGRTAAELGRLIADAPLVWALLAEIRPVLDQAIALQDQRKSGELLQLLDRPSLGPPIADGYGPAITLSAAVDRLRQSYQEIRAAVAAVDTAWRDVLPRVDAALVELSRLDAAALDIGSPGEPAVESLRARVTELTAKVGTDPLSLSLDVTAELDQMLASAAGRIGEIRDSHEQLGGDFARAEPLLAEIRSLHSQARAARAQAIEKIAGSDRGVAVPSDASLDRLAARLDRAEGSEPWQARRLLLDQWFEDSERFRAQLARAVEHNHRGLDRREELRGLLRAYVAKLGAIGLAEDPTATDLARMAHDELYTAPTDLDRGAELVAALGAELQQGGGAA